MNAWRVIRLDDLAAEWAALGFGTPATALVVLAEIVVWEQATRNADWNGAFGPAISDMRGPYWFTRRVAAKELMGDSAVDVSGSVFVDIDAILAMCRRQRCVPPQCCLREGSNRQRASYADLAECERRVPERLDLFTRMNLTYSRRNHEPTGEVHLELRDYFGEWSKEAEGALEALVKADGTVARALALRELDRATSVFWFLGSAFDEADRDTAYARECEHRRAAWHLSIAGTKQGVTRGGRDSSATEDGGGAESPREAAVQSIRRFIQRVFEEWKPGVEKRPVREATLEQCRIELGGPNKVSERAFNRVWKEEADKRIPVRHGRPGAPLSPAKEPPH